MTEYIPPFAYPVSLKLMFAAFFTFSSPAEVVLPLFTSSSVFFFISPDRSLYIVLTSSKVVRGVITSTGIEKIFSVVIIAP